MERPELLNRQVSVCMAARSILRSAPSLHRPIDRALAQASKAPQPEVQALPAGPRCDVPVLHVAGPAACSLAGISMLSLASAEPVQVAMQGVSDMLCIVCQLLPTHGSGVQLGNGSHDGQAPPPGLLLALPLETGSTSSSTSDTCAKASSSGAMQAWLCAQPASVTRSSHGVNGGGGSPAGAPEPAVAPSLDAVVRALHVLAAHDPQFAVLLAELALSLVAPPQHAAPERARHSAVYSPQGSLQDKGAPATVPGTITSVTALRTITGATVPGTITSAACACAELSAALLAIHSAYPEATSLTCLLSLLVLTVAGARACRCRANQLLLHP